MNMLDFLNNRQIFIILIFLFISNTIITGISSIPTTTFLNRSLSSIQTSNLHLWKKSNSIETLKKFIANRHNFIKNHHLPFLPSTTQRIGSISLRTALIQVKPIINLPNTTFHSPLIKLKNKITTNVRYLPTTQHNLLLHPSLASTTDQERSSNIITIIIIFISCSSGFLLLILTFIIFLRENFNSAYFKLPCILSLSTTKQARDTTPLSYSPIHSKYTVTKEFSVDQLYDIYTQRHALDDLIFGNEFKSIPNFEELPCTSASRSIIALKNRFVNVLPIDATRVILNTQNNDPATDYINGNYISGYKCSKKFIATQGPTPDTCEDFWRMIWELKLKSIVMLTNLIEGASQMTKCHQYWPELHETIIYGSYQITCIDKQCLCDYEKRYFQLTKISNDKEFLLPSSSSFISDDASSSNNEQQYCFVVQYHYTQWKDMDIPQDSHTLLHLINEVNEQTTIEQYPIVVHCTAGVGRTGTYIAIDAMINKIIQEKRIDIFDFVSQMRRERHLMVQTVKQYVFIYRSLLEYYLFGNTRIDANMFSLVYSNLKKNKQLLLTSEYNKLTSLPIEHVFHRDAQLADNVARNRCTRIVPYDHNRVGLSRILGHPYINASLIEGYSRECSFIITQDPLSETVHEFWRMFIEHDCNCIVQLHTIIECSPKCAIYYPNDVNATMKIGSTSLLRLVEKDIIQEKFIIRQLCLTDTREALSKMIYQYEYLLPISTNDQDESGQCIPTILSNTLFDFIGYINKQSQRNNHGRCITVHCGNGGPACSIFCMSVILLDQLKNEHAVDIFQRVRTLQRQRLAMITSLTQYEYLYEVVLKFLEESFDIAALTSSPSLNNSIYDNDQENFNHPS